MGLLYRNGRVWVPYEANLQQKILIKNYDDLLGSHYGLTKTVELLYHKYYWPKLRQEAKKHISYCKKCQLYKVHRHKLWGLFKSVSSISKLWKYYAIDFITDLLPSKNRQRQLYNSVLIFINRFLKYIQYLPINKMINV